MIRRTYAPAQPTLTSGDDRAPAPTVADIRAWARANGYPIAGGGRIPTHIQDAYDTWGNVVPDVGHRQTARRLARLHQRHGAEAVVEAVNALPTTHLPMVVAHLARMAREAL